VSFDPSLPKEGVNVSGTHPLREAVVLLAAVAGAGALLVVLAAAAVDPLVRHLPPSLEVKLFSTAWLADFGAGEEGEQGEVDPRAQALQELVGRLGRHWAGHPYPFRVAVWEQEPPNALALPGGRIVVTTGLLEQVESENELAFVLGHELGHFRNRDHLRGLGRGLAFALVMAAGGVSGAGSAAELAAVAGQLAERGFDREQERSADRFGLALVAAEYGHVAGAAEFFGRLPEPAGEVEQRIATYLATHPLNRERLEALRQAAAEEGWSTTGQLRPLLD
jgi:Zn-dependent protease with chaperone function